MVVSKFSKLGLEMNEISDKKTTSILVPSGIGDIFWVMVKMESFLKEQGIENPEIFVQAGFGSNGLEKRRSIPFVEKFPFVKAGSYIEVGNKFQAFKDGYFYDRENLFTNIAGCDLFLTYNGSLRFGRELADVHPEWETNWYPEMIRTEEQIKAGENYKLFYGSYMIGYFVPHGMYKGWLAQFSKDKIYESMRSVIFETKMKVILIGAKWDENQLENYFLERAEIDGIESYFINLVGKTNLTELLALVENCDLMYGFPSGASLLAPYYKKQTIMLWNNYFEEGFHWNCVVPESRNNWYHALQTYKHGLKEVTQQLLESCNV